MPVAALLAEAAGVASKTTFLYGINLTEPNNYAQLTKLEASGAFARSLDVDARNYQGAIDETTAHLTRIFSSNQKILVLEGGPMEASYRALAQVDESYHKNITLVSHSGWNENRSVTTRPGEDEARTWSDIGRDFPEVTRIEIADQNRGFFDSGWTWMDDSDLAHVQEARDRLEAAGSSKENDASDSGMLYYALTGDQNGEPADAQVLIEQGGDTPTPQVSHDTDGSQILDFYISDAASNEIIDRIVQDSSFDFDLLKGRDLTVIAVAEENPVRIGSVGLTFEGRTQIENAEPFALYGDRQGDLNGDMNLGLGQHEFKITVFERWGGQGAIVDEIALDFFLI